jgi:carbohydrate-selective porin OprB
MDEKKDLQHVTNPELEIIELDDRLDMAVDSFGLLSIDDEFFANNCDCTNSVAGCGQPVPTNVGPVS